MKKSRAALVYCILLQLTDGVLSFKGSSPSRITALLLTRPSSPKTVDHLGSKFLIRDNNKKLFQFRGGDSMESSMGDNEESFTILRKCAILLNASSKWLLAFANLYGVIRYKDPGAFLCTGCILAFFGTEHILKPLWNQARPAKAPLADPGMPSSHSLGSFFLAIGWAHILRDVGVSDPLLPFFAISSVIASLRIICGYHTVAQVLVGALLGMALGHGWIDWIWKGWGVKQFLYTHATVRLTIWSSYILGSLLFIWKIMSKWIDGRMLLH